jgi:hypothetical protein
LLPDISLQVALVLFFDLVTAIIFVVFSPLLGVLIVDLQVELELLEVHVQLGLHVLQKLQGRAVLKLIL